ncbi:Wadjet anti-phage system protein JetD domain-containing protein [Clostridium beijerinckii]|nr:Wadjet anti-phage system protein JetD domain-containing protein [Clostridium beijerinckii]MZL18531.1 hypothetical protein [Clostridium beijerinckii]
MILDMQTLNDIVKKSIEKYRENQGSKKKRIDIDNFEEEIIKILHSQENYNSLGGYREFYSCIKNLENSCIIVSLTSNKDHNSKKPFLSKFWWLMPKYKSNQWDSNTIAKLSTVLDISFYIRNKKYQTIEELDKIMCIYKYLKSSPTSMIIIREERSLSIFNDAAKILNCEPEKFLSSSEGKTLLNRLNLSYNNLNCEVISEPFDFWINSTVNSGNKSEVLIIEGLATYNSIKNILKNSIYWKLGTIPYIVIWGAGRQIEGTINYLHDIMPNPHTLRIRYAGDIDSEGLDIFYNLKNKNKHLNIILATHFYDFLITYFFNASKPIITNQRRIFTVLESIKAEFQSNSDVFSKIEYLWFNKLRIPQEFINLETLTKEGWLYYA